MHEPGTHFVSMTPRRRTAEPEDRLSDELRVELRAYPEVVWTDAIGLHQVTVTGPLVLGSARRVGVRIADAAVSRLHAELDVRDGQAWIRDLGSRNGTFVNGVRVEIALVAPGARIQVGDTVIAVHAATLMTPVEVWPDATFCGLVGESTVTRELFARLKRIARTDESTLLTGEPGTGKRAIARAIHQSSPRWAQPFVVLESAELTEESFDDQAFTQAAGGTVYLRDVSAMPMAAQETLARKLGTLQIAADGGPAPLRFLAGTRHDLRERVNAGLFSEDLYFRLAVFAQEVPPLRSRVDDIPVLVARFAGGSVQAASIDKGILAELSSRPWADNVRELRGFVERALASEPPPAMTRRPAEDERDTDVESLPLSVRTGAFEVIEPQTTVPTAWLLRLERAYLITLLEDHHRNFAAAAGAAGVDENALRALLAKHGL